MHSSSAPIREIRGSSFAGGNGRRSKRQKNEGQKNKTKRFEKRWTDRDRISRSYFSVIHFSVVQIAPTGVLAFHWLIQLLRGRIGIVLNVLIPWSREKS
jgi:hypothetical protein